MKTKLLISGFLLIIISVFFTAWWKQSIKAVNPLQKDSILFIIERGENIKNISQDLEKENLIRSKLAFYLLARFGGYGDKIQAGEFRLNTSMDLNTLIKELTHGTVDTKLTIPEGWRNEEIALLITQEFGIPEGEFLKFAKEGFMFPDTYLFPKDVLAEEIAKIMLDNFSKKIKIITLNTGNGLYSTIDDLIIIASLIEREAKITSDRPLIASVILNRLKIGMKLDIDATVQYALGFQPEEKDWWKKSLSLDDLAIDSPYNTYKYAGLPPGPICNPGLASIKAVLEAPNTQYLYYLADKTGKTHYAESLEQHNENISRYLNNK